MVSIARKLKTSESERPVTDIQLVIPSVVSRPCDGHQYCEVPGILVPGGR